MSRAVVTVALSDPHSKDNEELLLKGFFRVDEVRVAACIGAELKPIVTIFCLQLVILCCRGNNCLPASIKITSKLIPCIRGTSFQGDKLCGRGKGALKWVSIEALGTLDAAFVSHFISLPRDRRNGERSSTGCSLYGSQASKEPFSSEGLGLVVSHVLGPCHGGCVVQKDAGPDIDTTNPLYVVLGSYSVVVLLQS
jgi:hypothetical protein